MISGVYQYICVCVCVCVCVCFSCLCHAIPVSCIAQEDTLLQRVDAPGDVQVAVNVVNTWENKVQQATDAAKHAQGV